ncbi:MAG: aldo/keto reductase, partial [Planctomycetota bacterium]
MDSLSRRSFLALSSAALAFPARLVIGSSEPGEPSPSIAPLPTVTLGRTGRTVPRLGFGGAPIGRLSSARDAVEVVKAAVRFGVRYLDTAPSYSRGRSEQRIGAALAACGVDRSELFIATKTLRRDGSGARRELEESLERLGTDYVDALQVHEVHDDVDNVFGEGAVLEALQKAKEEGLIRHMVNPLDVKHLSFVQEFLPLAAEKGTAVIAMKVYGGGSLLDDDRFTAGELLRYALSTPQVDVAVPGCDEIAHVAEAHAAVSGFKTLAPEELAALEERAGAHRGKKSEWYKQER